MEIFIPPLLRREGVQTMDLYIETNIHPSILFSPHAPNSKGTFAIFHQGYFIMTTPVYENLLTPTPPCLFHPYYN